jgi:hypothetical protein
MRWRGKNGGAWDVVGAGRGGQKKVSVVGRARGKFRLAAAGSWVSAAAGAGQGRQEEEASYDQALSSFVDDDTCQLVGHSERAAIA